MSDQRIITETMLEWSVRQKYIQFIQETGLVLSLNEYKLDKKFGQHRRFDSAFKKILQYGVTAFFARLPGKAVQAAGAAGGSAAVLGPVGALVAVGGTIISAFFVWQYRRNTDSCRVKCKKEAKGKSTSYCMDKCYFMATTEILKDINSELSKAKAIKDPKVKAKVIKGLMKAKANFTKKGMKYKSKMGK